jgi:hypothetical protein
MPYHQQPWAIAHSCSSTIGIVRCLLRNSTLRFIFSAGFVMTGHLLPLKNKK